MTPQRITIAIENELLSSLEELLERRSPGNRSEAVRDLIRRRLIPNCVPIACQAQRLSHFLARSERSAEDVGPGT